MQKQHQYRLIKLASLLISLAIVALTNTLHATSSPSEKEARIQQLEEEIHALEAQLNQVREEKAAFERKMHKEPGINRPKQGCRQLSI